MRIGIDARNIYRIESGDGRYTVSIISALAKIDKGNEYVIWVRPGKRELFDIGNNSNFKFREIDLPAYSIKEQFIMPFLAKKERVDLFHSFSFYAPYILPCPSIITVYDLIFLHFPRFYPALKRFLGRALVIVSAARANKIITISRHSMSDIISSLKNIKQEKIRIIYCGCGSQFKISDKMRGREFLRDRYGLSGEFILYVGNMNQHKNIPALIKTLKECLNDNLSLKLVICGKKKMVFYPRIKELISKLGVESNVLFIHDADDLTEAMLYSAAKIFISLSLHEGFGMPAIEAMACSTPVVASNRGSLPEILGEAALLVDPENIAQALSAIKLLLNDQDLYKRKQEEGLARCAFYSWDKSARELLEIYKDVFDKIDYNKPRAFVETGDFLSFSNSPKVSVIIPSFDGFRGGNLPKLIDDLKMQSFRDFEVHIIKRVSPQGKAINLGVKKAKGEIIVILDDDSRIDNSQVLKNLVETVDRGSRIGMAGAAILAPPDANWLQRIAGRQFPRFSMQVVNRTTESDMACHGCCAIPKKVFYEVGGERENILRGLDPDLRFRLRQKGYKTVLAANTWVYHPLPGTFGKFIKTFFRNGMGSAYCLKFQPGLIYDTDEEIELKAFNPRQPFLLRVFRFPVRMMKALIELKFLKFFSQIIYACGFYYGILKYSLKRGNGK